MIDPEKEELLIRFALKALPAMLTRSDGDDRYLAIRCFEIATEMVRESEKQIQEMRRQSSTTP